MTNRDIIHIPVDTSTMDIPSVSEFVMRSFFKHPNNPSFDTITSVVHQELLGFDHLDHQARDWFYDVAYGIMPSDYPGLCNQREDERVLDLLRRGVQGVSDNFDSIKVFWFKIEWLIEIVIIYDNGLMWSKRVS